MERRTGVLARAFAITAISLPLMLLAHGRGLAGQCETNGACYVTPTGAGTANGVDWNNAYAGFPTTFTCAVNYFVAGGSYDYTATTTTVSNTCSALTPISIYKAVSGGPGNPQSVPGWVASYGTSQAIFSQTQDADPENRHNQFLTLSGSYITMDGITPISGTPSSTGTFGFVFKNPNRTNPAFILVTGSNITVRHIEGDGTRPDYYGVPITSCSANGTTETVNLGSSISGVWANGDKIDIYNVTPSGLAPTNVTMTIVNGTQITVPNSTSGACTVAGNSFAILNFSPGEVFHLNPASPSSNVTISDNYIHDSGGLVQVVSCDNCTIVRNYLARTLDTATQHENAIDGPVFNNSTIAQNIFVDIMGTGFITPTCGGSCNWQNDSIYSNVFFCSQAADANQSTPTVFPQCFVSSLISDDNSSNQVTNMLAYGNTFVMRANANCKIEYGNASSTATVENNVIWCPAHDASRFFIIASTHDYNTAFSYCNNVAGTPGPHDYYYTSPGSPGNCTNKLAYVDPFVNDADSAMDFQLSSETVDPHLNDGVTLPAPYNLDLLGATRGADGTWERGAYEFNSGAPARPNPPTGLSVTGVH